VARSREALLSVSTRGGDAVDVVELEAPAVPSEDDNVERAFSGMEVRSDSFEVKAGGGGVVLAGTLDVCAMALS